jgi:hypothetical protein
MESLSSRNKNRTKDFAEETHEFFPLLRRKNFGIIERNIPRNRRIS